MKQVEDNVLVPFPSLLDEKLMVSTTPINTCVEILQTSDNIRVANVTEAVKIVNKLPSFIPTFQTPKGVGSVRISGKSRDKLINKALNLSMPFYGVYLELLNYVVDLVEHSLLIEQHRDRVKNQEGKRLAQSPSDNNIDYIQRLYCGVRHKESMYVVKTTLQTYYQKTSESKHHGYDIMEIELLSPKTGSPTRGEYQSHNHSNSISIANLLKNVELSYEPGVKVIDAMVAARTFLLTGDKTEMYRVFAKGYNNHQRIPSIIEEARELLGEDWNKPQKKDEMKNESKGLKL